MPRIVRGSGCSRYLGMKIRNGSGPVPDPGDIAMTCAACKSPCVRRDASLGATPLLRLSLRGRTRRRDPEDTADRRSIRRATSPAPYVSSDTEAQIHDGACAMAGPADVARVVPGAVRNAECR